MPAPTPVLVLDDDADFRALVRVALEETLAPCEVLEAGLVAEADRILEGTPVDLMVVDGQLPDETGLSFIERRREAGDTTPIVFVSAFWTDYATYRLLVGDLGVNLVFSKPVTPDELSTELRLARGALDLEPTAEPLAVEATLPPSPLPRLEKLRERYVEALDGQLIELRTHLADAGTGVDVHGHCVAAHDLAHRIHGTAGSYRFGGVSRVVASIEHTLQEALRGGELAIEAPWDELIRAVEHARRLATPESAPGFVEAPAYPGLDARGGELRERFLVVTDNPELLDRIREAGRRLMIAVTPAARVREAVIELGKQSFDGILIDEEVEGGGAFALARRLVDPGQWTDGEFDLVSDLVQIDLDPDVPVALLRVRRLPGASPGGHGHRGRGVRRQVVGRGAARGAAAPAHHPPSRPGLSDPDRRRRPRLRGARGDGPASRGLPGPCPDGSLAGPRVARERATRSPRPRRRHGPG